MDFRLDDALPVLRRTPAVLNGWLGGIMARQYTDVLGPWRAYLSILGRRDGCPARQACVAPFGEERGGHGLKSMR